MISISMNKSRAIALAAVTALAVFTAPSHASTLIGNVIEAQYEFPSIGIPYSFSSVTPNPFTVGDGFEAVIDIEGVTQLNIDFSESSLLITLDTILGNPTWNAAAQNGPVFSVVSGIAFPAIANVVFSSGFVCAFPFQECVYLSQDSDKLFINWAGWSYHDGATVRVDFATSPVPLPAALPLFAAGLGAMGFMGWRRKRRSV